MRYAKRPTPGGAEHGADGDDSHEQALDHLGDDDGREGGDHQADDGQERAGLVRAVGGDRPWPCQLSFLLRRAAAESSATRYGGT
jgi:hypothetical protein